MFLVIAICLLPFFFVENYIFHQWLYRAFIFFVISCPYALIIDIPLGYSGEIRTGSRNGILFKRSIFLETLANIQNVVVDKTRTMTEGFFKIQEVVFNSDFNKDEISQMVNVIESNST